MRLPDRVVVASNPAQARSIGSINDERQRIKLMRALILRYGLGKPAQSEKTLCQPLMSGGVVRIQIQRAAELRLGLLQLRIRNEGVA